jgi:hypothetical protein
VPQKNGLEKKRVIVPTPMIHELFPSVHVQEYIRPTFKVESSSIAPVIQEHEVSNAVIDDEEEQPQNLKNNVTNQENIWRSQRVRKSAISDDYEIYTSEEIHMEGDPTSYKEVMRSPHSSTWREAMEDEWGLWV